MTTDIVDRVLRSPRYRRVDRGLVTRLASEELPKARNADEAVKRVKRRLHQAVGAFRHAAAGGDTAWPADDAEALRRACLGAMRAHASTRERIPHLSTFYRAIWERTGVPGRVLDLGCGRNPLALPWMGIGGAAYLASDVDADALRAVSGFLDAVGQPHEIRLQDLVADPASPPADVALLLKLVTTLDRQDASAADRLLATLDVRHAVVTFATRSLGGRSGREAAYRARLDRLVREGVRVREVTEASVPNELVFVLALEPLGA